MVNCKRDLGRVVGNVIEVIIMQKSFSDKLFKRS